MAHHQRGTAAPSAVPIWVRAWSLIFDLLEHGNLWSLAEKRRKESASLSLGSSSSASPSGFAAVATAPAAALAAASTAAAAASAAERNGVAKVGFNNVGNYWRTDPDSNRKGLNSSLIGCVWNILILREACTLWDLGFDYRNPTVFQMPNHSELYALIDHVMEGLGLIQATQAKGEIISFLVQMKQKYEKWSPVQATPPFRRFYYPFSILYLMPHTSTICDTASATLCYYHPDPYRHVFFLCSAPIYFLTVIMSYRNLMRIRPSQLDRFFPYSVSLCVC